MRAKTVKEEAKLQNTQQLICISLNKKSNHCYMARSSKHTDTCNGWAGVFCNRSQETTIYSEKQTVPNKQHTLISFFIRLCIVSSSG